MHCARVVCVCVCVLGVALTHVIGFRDPDCFVDYLVVFGFVVLSVAYCDFVLVFWVGVLICILVLVCMFGFRLFSCLLVGFVVLWWFLVWWLVLFVSGLWRFAILLCI